MSGSPKNIAELISVLEKLKLEKKKLGADSDLYYECREVFEKLKLLSDFDENNLDKVIKTLDDLPRAQKELPLDELGEVSEELESKALNKEDLKDLIEDYEKATSDDEREEIGHEIYKRTGKRNVEEFIKKQREIAAKNAERLKALDPKLQEKVAQDLAALGEDRPEEVARIIERASLEDKFDKRELEKAIKKTVKKPEEVKRIVRGVEEIRAEVLVERKAEEISKKTYEKLVSENAPVTPKVQTDLKREILKSWRGNEEIVLPSELVEISQDTTVIGALKEADNFKGENLREVVNYRAVELKREIGESLRDSGIHDEALIEDYTTVVNELTNNPENVRTEVLSMEVEDHVRANTRVTDNWTVTRSVEEAQFLAKNVVMAPKKFNMAVRRYNQIRKLIDKDDKLPKIKEIRVLDKMMDMFAKNPKVLAMMNRAQRMIGILEKIDNFPQNLALRFITSDTGMSIITKIGGQATAAFVKNSAMTLAEQGTLNGMKTILTNLFSKGAVTAGTEAAAGTTAAGGAAAAGLSATGVGLIIVAVTAVIMVVGKLFGKFKNWLKSALNINLGAVGDFFSDTLGLGGAGKFAGGLLLGIGAFFASIPMFLMNIGMIVGPVVVFFFLGIFGYSMLQQNMVSSIVPPADMSNCVLKSDTGGDTNCDPNAPENSWPAVDKANFIDVANRWQAGTNYASVCYNDVVNRALCAGINPTYALWTWLHESGASNYSRSDIEDFGIHFIPENNNFNAQITAFLKLDPGSACINDPRIGGDYWLAFSANFLNGDCDPDKGNSIFPDMTPRKYAAELRETWTWISNAPMPNSIHVPKGGQNCGSIGNSEALPGNAKEVVIDGKTYICTENTQEAGGNYDPNSPGLGGIIVDGECSVGDVVVPTKQCDSQWGSKQLSGESCSNGKPGTICSAGCGPTSVSMMMRHVNGSLTPDTVIFSSGSAYSGMGCNGSSLDQAQRELSKKFGSGAVTYNAATQGCDEKAIAKWICEGKVVMVLANFYRNSNLDLGGHFVLAIGVRNGKIVVADPYYDRTDTPFDGTRAFGYAHDIRGCLTVEKSAVK